MADAGESPIREGRVLCGKWRLDAPIAEGGMATVWRGSHRNGLRVAIKILRPQLAAIDATRERFMREGYLVNRVEHRGIVKVLDDDVTDDGVVFLVMELLQGTTLGERWKEQGKTMSPQEVAAVAREILDVLHAAHEAGIIHRDLKPDNVFLLEGGGLKLLDFGVARMREGVVGEAATRVGATLGTPAFMAPEQAMGLWDSVDARTDLFSLGATMWKLLTGKMVHSATSISELMIAAGSKHAQQIRRVMPSLPAPLAEVIDRALEFNAADRWQSAAEMRDALIALGDLAPESASPPTEQIPGRVRVASKDTEVTDIFEITAPTSGDRETPTEVVVATVVEEPVKKRPLARTLRLDATGPLTEALHTTEGLSTSNELIASRRQPLAVALLVALIVLGAVTAAVAVWRFREDDVAPPAGSASKTAGEQRPAARSPDGAPEPPASSARELSVPSASSAPSGAVRRSPVRKPKPKDPMTIFD